MRQLQLKRFNIIFKNRETALANLQKYENSYADGEIMAAAFYNDDTQTADNIAYIVGIYVKKGDKKKLFTLDVKDIESHIEEVKNFAQQQLNTLQYASDVELVSADTYDTTTTDRYKVDLANTDEDKYFRLFFTPVSKDTDEVSVSIGDIKAGTTAAELKGYTLSRLIDAMLFKTIYPTILNGPSVSIKKSGANEVEVGTTVKVSDVSLTYTQGKAQVKMESGDLTVTADTGTETSRSITYNFNNNAPTDFNSDLALTSLGTYHFTGTVNYAEGDTLHDSKGNTGDTEGIQTAASTTKRKNPHPAGTVTATTSVTTYYKAGANNSSNDGISTIVKLDGIPGIGMKINFKTTETVDDNKKVVEGGGYQIAVPSAILNGTMNNIKIMKYNAASGKYDGDDTANWELTPNVKILTDAAGNTYNCDLLKHKKDSTGNDGAGAAVVSFQINNK